MGAPVEIVDNPHSDLGPSGAKRWMHCAGSVRASKGVPDEQSSYALYGTAGHTVAEWCHDRGVRAESFLDTVIHVKGAADVTVDRAMVDGVNQFLDYCADIPGESHSELRVRYTRWVKNGFGTSDRVNIDKTVAHIIDLKLGEGVQVFAENCEQLMLYGLGWWHDYGWLYPDITDFVLHIVQPRIGHFDKWSISLADLLKWADEVLAPAALATEAEDAPFKAGPWCSQNFCRIRKTCKHRAKDLMEQAIGDFENLNAPMKALPTLDNSTIEKIYLRFSELTKWMGEIKSHIYAELQHGRPVGGLKLVGGKSSRSFTKPAAAVIEAVKDVDLDIEEKDLLTEPELKSVAKVEELVGAKHFRAATEKKPAGALAHLVSKTPGRPTIATHDDKRPALTVDALQEFEDLGPQADAD
jgi:hypothetical protein